MNIKRSIVFTPIPLVTILLIGCSFTNAYEAKGIDQYDKNIIVKEHSSHLDSNLSIFPDEIKAIEGKATYYAYVSNEFFDKNPEIFLQCEYSSELFLQEIQRLSDISITIKFKDKSYTNYIKYDDKMYNYPAYIAIDGYDSAYEYALVNFEKCMITYLYFGYPIKDTFEKYSDYIKKDMSSYNHTGLDCFTIYAQSFDGGNSYVEFDD